jgi:hypothetical protein
MQAPPNTLGYNPLLRVLRFLLPVREKRYRVVIFEPLFTLERTKPAANTASESIDHDQYSPTAKHHVVTQTNYDLRRLTRSWTA